VVAWPSGSAARGVERKFLEPLMRLAPRDVKGPHRFAEKRPRTFVLALRRLATVERPQILLSRDFRRCSIFDFCNKIGQLRKWRRFPAFFGFGV
jgi:hypothetical protein